MVGSGHVVKLGDFGMTRAMFDSDYYRFGRKGKLLQFSFCFNTITVTFVTFGQNYPHKSLFMIFQFNDKRLIGYTGHCHFRAMSQACCLFAGWHQSPLQTVFLQSSRTCGAWG